MVLVDLKCKSVILKVNKMILKEIQCWTPFQSKDRQNSTNSLIDHIMSLKLPQRIILIIKILFVPVLMKNKVDWQCSAYWYCLIELSTL